MLIKFLAGSIAGGIAMYLSGFLLFGLLLNDYFAANAHQYAGLQKDPPEMISLFLFNLVWAGLLCFVFVKWAGVKDFVSGMAGGAIIMLFVVLGMALQFTAFMNLYIGVAPIIVNIAVTTILGAISGGVIGFVLGKFEGKAAQD